MFWRALFLTAAIALLAISKDRIWHSIKDPNISLLFIVVGLVLVYAECLLPGSAIFASIGGVFLLVGIFGFSMQLLSYRHLLMLMCGAILICMEALWPMFGTAALAGVVLVNCGGVMLCAGMKLNWTGPILTSISGLTLLLLRFASIAWSNKHLAISAIR